MSMNSMYFARLSASRSSAAAGGSGAPVDGQHAGDGTPLRVFRSGRLPVPRGRRGWDVPPRFRLAGALAARIEHVVKRLRVEHVFGPGLQIGRRCSM